jgi:dipeptidyl aminopeptidase/acylaminoacyl peptidase
LYNDPKAFEYKALGGAFESKQDVIKMINAETYIGTNEPPFFIRHGNNDHALPFLQSVDFASTLKSKGNKVDFAIVPDAQHGLPGMNFFQKFDVKEMYDWLAANL